MQQLDKQVYGPWALVTGASSGIGEEFARQAAASGINVVLVARREERLKEVASGLTARYDVETRVLALDLGRDGILGPVREATGDLDIGLVVSNAGAGNPGPFISLPHQRLREIVQLNVITHLDLAHHFGQQLARRGRGGIVLVSAVAAAGGAALHGKRQRDQGLPAQPRRGHPRRAGAGRRQRDRSGAGTRGHPCRHPHRP